MLRIDIVINHLETTTMCVNAECFIR